MFLFELIDLAPSWNSLILTFLWGYIRRERISAYKIKCLLHFVFGSTTEYNERLHQIQRTLSDIKNEATRELQMTKK